jgi:FtsH-binding integral membrane protein
MNTIATATNQGLRSYMINVYNWMSAGVALTGAVSWAMVTSGAAAFLAANFWVMLAVTLSPFAIILGMVFARNNPPLAGVLFLALATLMGMSMSTVFLAYKLGTIFTAFFATAIGFLGTSLFGYTTKTDMSGLSTFFTVALFGMIGLMIVNIFFHSTVFTLAISAAGVLLFAGLTAYDTQKIKNEYGQGYGDSVTAIYGALTLYLDFVNMFLFILRILGMAGNND